MKRSFTWMLAVVLVAASSVLLMGQAGRGFLTALIGNFGGLSNSVETDLLGGMAGDIYNFNFRTSHVMEKEAGLSLRTRSGFEKFGNVGSGNISGIYGYAANGRIEHILAARGNNLLVYNPGLDTWAAIDTDVRAGVCSCTNGNDTIYVTGNTAAWFGLSLEAYTQVKLDGSTYNIKAIMSDTFLVMRTNFSQTTSAAVACTLGSGGGDWDNTVAFGLNDIYLDKHGVMFGDTLYVFTGENRIAYGGKASIAASSIPAYHNRSSWFKGDQSFTLTGAQGPPAGTWNQIVTEGTSEYNLAMYCIAGTGNTASFYCDEPLFLRFIAANHGGAPTPGGAGGWLVKESHDVDAVDWDTLLKAVIDSVSKETVFSGEYATTVVGIQSAIQRATSQMYAGSGVFEWIDYIKYERQILAKDSLFIYRWQIYHTSNADAPDNWPLDTLGYMTVVAQPWSGTAPSIDMSGTDGLVTQKFPVMMDTSLTFSHQDSTFPASVQAADSLDFVVGAGGSSLAGNVNVSGNDATYISGTSDSAYILFRFAPDTTTITGDIDSVKVFARARKSAPANGSYAFEVIMKEQGQTLVVLDTINARTGATFGWDSTGAILGITKEALDTLQFGVRMYTTLDPYLFYMSEFKVEYFVGDLTYTGRPYFLVTTFGTKGGAGREVDSTMWYVPWNPQEVDQDSCSSDCTPDPGAQVRFPKGYGFWHLDSVFSAFCLGPVVHCAGGAGEQFRRLCWTWECSRSDVPVTTTSVSDGADDSYEVGDSLFLLKMARNTIITRTSSFIEDTTWHYPIVITMMDRLWGTGDTNSAVITTRPSTTTSALGGENRVVYTQSRTLYAGSDVDTSENWFYVESATGEINTALSSEQNILYVHKPSGIWSVPLDDTGVPLGVFPTKSRAGALSMRGLISCWRGTFFVSYGGVYQFQRGGDTQYGNNASSQMISEPINQFWIDSLDRARLPLASVSYSKRFDRLYVSVTRKGTQSALLGNDVTLVYDFRTQLWGKYNIGIGVTAELAYPGKEPVLYFGSPKHAHGQVLRFTENPQDSGQTINSTWSTGLLALGGIGNRVSLYSYFLERRLDTSSTTIFSVFVDNAATASFTDTLSAGTGLWTTERRDFPHGLVGERFTFKLEFQADTSAGIAELSALRVDYIPAGEI